MSRAVSIHIGVNQPQERLPGEPLRHSEATAWRMAELAHQAGYRSLLVLQGDEATRQAVHDALAGAARALGSGDTLFVSFSGHGTRRRDLGVEVDERDGWDEAWCLSDSVLVDDKLAGYWRLFDAGVRIVVVTESCYGGGMGRTGDCPGWPESVKGGPAGGGAPASRARLRGEAGAAGPELPCIERAPRIADGIRASLLLLSACGEHQLARDGLFAGQLCGIWNGGKFGGSFCELYRQVRERVMREGCGQEPRILMLGAPDPELCLAPAFHLPRRKGGRRVAYR